MVFGHRTLSGGLSAREQWKALATGMAIGVAAFGILGIIFYLRGH